MFTERQRQQRKHARLCGRNAVRDIEMALEAEGRSRPDLAERWTAAAVLDATCAVRLAGASLVASTERQRQEV